jgi:hypothetical protein
MPSSGGRSEDVGGVEMGSLKVGDSTTRTHTPHSLTHTLSLPLGGDEHQRSWGLGGRRAPMPVTLRQPAESLLDSA